MSYACNNRSDCYHNMMLCCYHRRTGHFFLGEGPAKPPLTEKYFDRARKNDAHLTWPNSMLSTNWNYIYITVHSQLLCPTHSTQSLAKTRISDTSSRWTKWIICFRLNKVEKCIFECYLLPENLAIVRKILLCPNRRGWGGSSPLSPLARTPMFKANKI